MLFPELATGLHVSWIKMTECRYRFCAVRGQAVAGHLVIIGTVDSLERLAAVTLRSDYFI